MKEMKKIEEDYKRLIRKYVNCNLIEYFSKKFIELYMLEHLINQIIKEKLEILNNRMTI